MPMLTRKRKLNPVPHSKKLRSKIPRRKRLTVFPIIANPDIDYLFPEKEQEFSAFPAASCSSTCFSGDLSCISGIIFARSKKLAKKPRSSLQKKVETGNAPKNEANGAPGVSFSETSCSESFSEVNDKNSCKFDEFSEKTRKSRPISPGNEENEARLASSCLESFSPTSFKAKMRSLNQKSVDEDEPSGIAVSESSCFGSVQNLSNLKRLNRGEKNFDICRSESVTEQKYDDSSPGLGCSEQLSSADSDYSANLELMLSQFESQSCPTPLSDESLELSSSFPYLDSSEEISEICRENSVKSACFAQLLQFSQKFCRSSFVLESEDENGHSEDFVLLKFEDEEHEESYRRFRGRERRRAFLHDYSESYSSTECGDLCINLRLQMVNWIVKHSSTNNLKWETVFLGVSLFDRFLCKGFFKDESLLHILGIACVTLATRIEENQPLNSIRQKNFQVGNNNYSRSEVVAMEWLIQEVLSFQCFFPTTFNFLWFYLKAAKADEQVEKCVKYLAVLSLTDHEILRFFPSTVAAGLVVLACLVCKQDSACHLILETHIRNKKDDLAECIERLEWLVNFLEEP